MKYQIITDASCDLPKEIVEKYGIVVVPIEVIFGDEVYPNGLETNEFYQKVYQTNILPKTAAPNQYMFQDYFEPFVNKEDVFVMTVLISSDMTSTINNAKKAVEELNMKNNYIGDSQATTWALGAIIIELCKFIEAKPREKQEVIDYFEYLKTKNHLICIIGDLKYLRLNGRLSSASVMTASVLNLKPILTFKDGKATVIAKALGEVKAQKFMVDFAKNRDLSYPVYFGQADIKDKLLGFMDQYKNELHIENQDEKIITEIGSVVASHASPKTYGICFFEK